VVVARVRRTILDRGLIAPGVRVLCACSGGPDSGAMLVALTRLSTELGFSLEAASVDHGLRAGAAADVEVARQQAGAAGVPFHALRVRVPEGPSLQAQARLARYRALLDLAASLGAGRVATGHTVDDQAETVLMRLLRGAWLPGLRAIDPSRPDGVVRPMIDCERAEVLTFARQHCPALARDPSNDDSRFERVRVRHVLLPALEAEDPAVRRHLAALADDARQAQEALVQTALELLPGLDVRIEGDETIDLSPLLKAPTAIRQAALGWLCERWTGRPPGRAHLQQLDRALSSPGEVWLPGDRLVLGAGDGTFHVSFRGR
jgi:tRNA(Ile)-lysidine synthase